MQRPRASENQLKSAPSRPKALTAAMPSTISTAAEAGCILRLIELLGQLLHGAGGQCSGDREGDEQPHQEDQGEVKIQERVSRWMRPNRGAPIACRRSRAAPATPQQKARMIEGRTGPRSATVYEGRASLALP